ncbi:hypothetical protein KIPB_000992 [Kipferlia bialata]|uniref:Uncharacterized protein n=1 Tax=Kipferlia bialata TaxID=797122 RepID=A0A9K3CNC3_9EUKA|nr:hypothetical protein KIPB_000992 [Kipferlia bialata]|eukprot:g992.t1
MTNIQRWNRIWRSASSSAPTSSAAPSAPNPPASVATLTDTQIAPLKASTPFRSYRVVSECVPSVSATDCRNGLLYLLLASVNGGRNPDGSLPAKGGVQRRPVRKTRQRPTPAASLLQSPIPVSSLGYSSLSISESPSPSPSPRTIPSTPLVVGSASPNPRPADVVMTPSVSTRASPTVTSSSSVTSTPSLKALASISSPSSASSLTSVLCATPPIAACTPIHIKGSGMGSATKPTPSVPPAMPVMAEGVGGEGPSPLVSPKAAPPATQSVTANKAKKTDARTLLSSPGVAKALATSLMPLVSDSLSPMAPKPLPRPTKVTEAKVLPKVVPKTMPKTAVPKRTPKATPKAKPAPIPAVTTATSTTSTGRKRPRQRTTPTQSALRTPTATSSLSAPPAKRGGAKAGKGSKGSKGAKVKRKVSFSDAVLIEGERERARGSLRTPSTSRPARPSSDSSAPCTPLLSLFSVAERERERDERERAAEMDSCSPPTITQAVMPLSPFVTPRAPVSQTASPTSGPVEYLDALSCASASLSLSHPSRLLATAAAPMIPSVRAGTGSLLAADRRRVRLGGHIRAVEAMMKAMR